MDDTARSIDAVPVGAAARSWLDRVRSGTLALDITIVGAVALVLGLIRLGTPSLWLDESLTATGNPIATFTDGYHWLYYSVEWPWMHFVGSSGWDLRFPSVVGSMLACGLLVVLGHRLFGRSVALASGLLLATSPFVVKWSQQARGYTLLLAVSLVATLLLLRALERGTREAWAAYGLAFAFVVVWHPVGGFLLAPAQLVLAAQRRERVRPHGLLAAVIVMALGVPWAAQIAMRSTGQGVAIDWLKRPSPGTAAHAFLDVSGAAGLGVLLAALGLWVLSSRSDRDLAVWLGTWALAPFAVALAVSIMRPIYLDRYLIVAAPAFALLGGVAIVGLGRRSTAGLVAAAVVATGIGLGQWYSTGRHGNWHGEDWRDAVATVVARHGDAPIVVAPWQAEPAATYYGVHPVSGSTAGTVWVLWWSQEKQDMTPVDRREIGLVGDRRVEMLRFGSRLSAQLWRRP